MNYWSESHSQTRNREACHISDEPLLQKRITFLREDADGVRSLYTSLWSDDTRPVICEVNTDPIVTDRYCRICERTGTQGQEITQRFNISMLLSPNSPCALVSSSSVPKFTKRTRRAGIEGKVRRKRAWIFPGTLWCGTGSKAAGYEQLGMFESADRCCREHDHCLHVILAFTVNYGVFNSNLFTVSLCDCDQRFRQCLLGVNDTISSMVGYSFFNILQVPCFELKQQKQCTEMNWWGTCKVTKKAPYAVFKSPLPFSAVTSNNGDNTDSNMVARSKGKHVTESFVINPHKKSPKGERRCNSRDRLKGDTFYLRRTEGKGCKKHRKLNTTTPSQLPPMSIVYTTSPSIKKGILNASKSTVMMPIKKRTGKKKSNMNGLSDYVTQRQNSYPQTTSARQSSPSLTQKPALQLHLSTTITAVTKSHKEVPKQSRCCGFKMPLRGDTFQPHCKSCLEQKKTLSVTPVTPSTITYGLPVKMATDMTLRLKQTTETPKQDTLQRLWSAATSATAVITKPDISTSIHKKGKPQKQRKSLLRQNNTHNQCLFVTPSENQLLCGSLILLDECKYNILPLEKKYDLQNRESKTAYHCDCTSRLINVILLCLLLYIQNYIIRHFKCCVVLCVLATKPIIQHNVILLPGTALQCGLLRPIIIALQALLTQLSEPIQTKRCYPSNPL
uniref:phospholipase A2 n=1 Tax=Cyclopterus lumpus TaxID=8103 RepID=A0A8C2Z2N0_CYCLU